MVVGGETMVVGGEAAYVGDRSLNPTVMRDHGAVIVGLVWNPYHHRLLLLLPPPPPPLPICGFYRL